MLKQPRPLVPFTFPRTVIPYDARLLATQPSYLTGFWKLDETTSTIAYDSSGNGCNGTYTGGYTLNADSFPDGAAAASFNGSTGFVDVFSSTLASLFSPDPLTIMGWFKPYSVALWSDGNTYGLSNFGSSDNTRRVSTVQFSGGGINTYYIAAGTSISVGYGLPSGGGWQHVALTVASGTMNSYLNGANIQTKTGLGTWSGALEVAHLARQLTRYWYGAAGRLALWSTALSAEEVGGLALVA